MTAEIGIRSFPGIETVSPDFLCSLVNLSLRHGWDPNGIALVISEESRFNPAAKNPRSSASGLIQFIESTAARLGTTTAAIRSMSAEEQLPFVERFFETALRGRTPARIEDYFLAVLGRSNLIGAPDATAIFVSGSAEYNANIGIDLDRDGVITVGDARAYMRRFIGQAGRLVGTFPAVCFIESPTRRAVSVALAAASAFAIAAAAGYGALVALRRI